MPTWKLFEPAPDLTTVLTANWQMTEGSGLSLADTSGNNNTITLYSGATTTWVTGPNGAAGNAIRLNGVASPNFSSAADSETLNLSTSSFSICGWIKLAATGTDARWLYKFGTTGGLTGYTVDFNSTATKIRIYLSSAGTGVAIETAHGFPDTGWHHVTLVCDRTTNNMLYYRDGVYVSTTAFTFGSGSLSNTSVLYLSTGGPTGDFSTSRNRIYQRRLGLREILYLFENKI